MRIVVWNCAMALHKKWAQLISLEPDLAIVPECAEPSRLWRRLKSNADCCSEWVGDNPNKGLGVFSFSGLSLARDVSYDDSLKHFLPVTLAGKIPVALLSIWAFNYRAQGGSTLPPKTTNEIVEQYSEFLTRGPAIVAGDFNNSTIWDRPGKASNFATLVSNLERRGFSSAYHGIRAASFGAELDCTLYWLKGKGEYHIDYCFLSREWKVSSVDVGKREDWLPFSDHVPLVVECDLPR